MFARAVHAVHVFPSLDLATMEPASQALSSQAAYAAVYSVSREEPLVYYLRGQ